MMRTKYIEKIKIGKCYNKVQMIAAISEFTVKVYEINWNID